MFNQQLEDGNWDLKSSFPSKLDILVHPNTPWQHKPENYWSVYGRWDSSLLHLKERSPAWSDTGFYLSSCLKVWRSRGNWETQQPKDVFKGAANTNIQKVLGKGIKRRFEATNFNIGALTVTVLAQISSKLPWRCFRDGVGSQDFPQTKFLPLPCSHSWCSLLTWPLLSAHNLWHTHFHY